MTDLSPVLNEARKDLLDLTARNRLSPVEPIGQPERLGRIDTGAFEPDVARADLARRPAPDREVCDRAKRIGDASDHPWRGLGRTVLLPPDQRRAGALRQGLETLRLAAGRLAADLGEAQPGVLTLHSLEPILDTVEFLSLAPDEIDPEALLDPAWETRREEIRELVAAGRVHQALRTGLEEQVAPGALDRDVRELAGRYGRYAGRWWRVVMPGWWLCRRKVGRLLRRPAALSPDERRDVLDRMIHFQAARRRLRGCGSLGQSAFGAAWRGLESDFAALADIEHWEGEGRAPLLLEQAPQRLALLARPGRSAELASQALRLLISVRRDLEALFQDLVLDRNEAFGVPEVEDIPLVELESRLAAWSGDGEAHGQALPGRVARCQQALEDRGCIS